MIIVSTETIPGREIKEQLGIVRGNTIRARHIGRDITAALRGLVGGEIKEYTEVFSEARDIALKRMISEAEEKGADAVINIRFTTSQVVTGAAELLVYGTAVRLE